MWLSPWLGSEVAFSSFLAPCLQEAKHEGWKAEVGKGPCAGIESAECSWLLYSTLLSVEE